MSAAAPAVFPESARACPKCGGLHKHFREFRASGGFWSSLFDFSTRRFRYVSCSHCSHTEFYNARIPGAVQFLDFLAGG